MRVFNCVSAALTATVLLVCPARATLYNVNFSNGPTSLVGTITTDGTIGPLFGENLLDWDFQVTWYLGGGHYRGPLSGGNSNFLYGYGTPAQVLSASTTGLFFNLPVIPSNSDWQFRLNDNSEVVEIYNSLWGDGAFVVTDMVSGMVKAPLVNGGQFGNAAPLIEGAAVSVPGPIVGAGLPGLILAGGGLFGWLRRRNGARAIPT